MSVLWEYKRADFLCNTHFKMERWNGKVAVVTGASAGIGEAIAIDLVKHGMQVVGLARRVEKVNDIAKKLTKEPGKLYGYKADMTKESDIVEAIQWTTKNVGPIHVLINNAGLSEYTGLIDGEVDKWRKVFDTNVIGLMTATKEVIAVMKTHKIDGHVVNINSVAGHKVVYGPGLNVYGATKFAVTNLTEMIRMELATGKSKIRITSVSPGIVKTQLLQDLVDKSDESSMFKSDEIPKLNPEDVAQAIIFALSVPPHVQIHELTIKPVGEMF